LGKRRSGKEKIAKNVHAADKTAKNRRFSTASLHNTFFLLM